MGKYDGMLLVELKAELRKRGKKLSGRKQNLIERLEYYDRNEINEELEVEYHMQLPNIANYKDVHSGTQVPNINKRRIEHYFTSFAGKYDEEKCDHMYQERWIKYVRLAAEDDFYFQCQLRAEMKKRVAYQVDVQVTADGVIMEAQCECAVGQGPTAHCKHVQLLLHALNSFCESGNLVTELTCTQVLQTFHHCKPWDSSPMKVTKMSEMRGKDKFTFDPRPVQFRKMSGYPDYFRNTCINYLQNPCDIPVSQLYRPANIPAMFSDHDYLELHAEDQFLRDSGLHTMTEAERDRLEVTTREQADCSMWMKERSKRITASKFGDICRATDRRDKKAQASSMIVRKEISTDAVRWGRRQESSAIKKFEEVTGKKTLKCGLFVSVTHPFMAATPDRLIGEDSVLEVKCPFSIRSQRITSDNVPWLKLGADEKLSLKDTHSYYYQVQGQLLCTGRQKCLFCEWTTKDILILEICRDENFLQEMLSKLELFVADYFKEVVIDAHLYRNYKKYFG